jgi:hypothetical protein
MKQFVIWLLKWPLGKQKAILWSRAFDDVAPSIVKGMVKWEIAHKMLTKARMIQFYLNLATQSAFGPQFFAIAKIFTKAFDWAEVLPGIFVTVALGRNSAAIAEWANRCVTEGYTHWWERDGKNWDSTMGRMHSRFKERIFEMFDPELAAFVAECTVVRGIVRGKDGVLRYTMRWTVKSGHNDTSSGNCLLNAAITVAALRDLNLRASMLVMGDDIVVALTTDFDEADMRTAEAAYGIIPEGRRFDNILNVTFISGLFVPSTQGFGFCPIPGRLLRRLWWTIKVTGSNVAQYRNGVVAGLRPTCRSIPIIRIFLEKFSSDAKVGASDKGYVYRNVDLDLGPHVWEWWYGRYKLGRAETLECEAWLATLPAEALVLVHPVLDRIAAVDCMDILEREENGYEVFGENTTSEELL